MPGLRIHRCRSRSTSSKGKQPPPTYRRWAAVRSIPGAGWPPDEPRFTGVAMVNYIVRRLMLAVLTVWAISVLSFMIIHLPPGDYVTSYIASMSASGSAVSEGEAQALREQLGLDKPITVQYAKWMGLILQGNFGMAMEWGGPVSDVIGDRLTLDRKSTRLH